MNIKPFGYIVAVALAASSVQAGLFVGPNTDLDGSLAGGGGEALVFHVASTIQVNSVSVIDTDFTGSATLTLVDVNNSSLGSATFSSGTADSTVGKWDVKNLGSPVTLTPGYYALVGLGSFDYAFTPSTTTTYSGLGAVTAYDTYYGGGTGTAGNVFNGVSGLGTPNTPAGGTWLGGFSARFRGVNFDFTPVPEPSTYALIGGLALVGFGLFRRQVSK